MPISYTPQSLVAAMQENYVPQHMHDGLINYILFGRPVGHFLTAVLSNDLKEACHRADEFNQAFLFFYVRFLYNHAPTGCWGSPSNVEKWIAQKGLSVYDSMPPTNPIGDTT